jgi:predicted dehydrogenase
VAILEWPKAIGIFTAATLQPNATAHRFFEVCGTKGTARVSPIEPPVLHLDLAMPPGSSVKKAAPLEFEFERYVGDFAELAACIQYGKPLSFTPEHDLAATETLFRACGAA